jgi:para-aminobenzoate synthetase component 2
LGHQSIVQAFGGDIIKGLNPIHGKVHEITHDGKGVFSKLKNPIKVTRYHSLVANRKTLPEDLIITSQTTEGEIMGVRHKRYPIEGVQFHPEALLTECGHEMLENFLRVYGNKN